MTLEQLIKQGLVKKASELEGLKRLPSGNLSVDYVLGGGWVFGAIHLLSGSEGVGKTTLTMTVCRALQQVEPDALTLVIDFERAWTRERLTDWDINLDRVLIYEPPSLEDGYDVLLKGVERCRLLIVDSIGAIASLAERAASVKERQYAVGARELNALSRRLVAKLNEAKTDPIVILISQIREIIGVNYHDTMPVGGHGVRHYAHIWLEITLRGRVTTQVGNEKHFVGQLISFKTRKNKTAPPFRTADAILVLNPYMGLRPPCFDPYFDVLTWGERIGFIKRKGSWFEADGFKWQGREGVYEQPLELINRWRDELRDKVINWTITGGDLNGVEASGESSQQAD